MRTHQIFNSLLLRNISSRMELKPPNPTFDENVNKISDHGSDNDSHYGQNDNMGDLNDMPPHDRPRPKEPVGLEGSRTEDMLVRIYNKVEGSDKVLKDLKNDFSTLSHTVTSHSVSIKQLETQMCQIVIHLNPRQKGTLPSDTISNPKNDC
ncbi:hypothetical protein MTR67_013307 [Solanum verrucosum]|uniref:Uncharacterized protein n=1 Tax=Solanum verrucosum TaxID=315347 RepID=A0AAF0QBL0_SOLVR|nr:hypothetical protein MTR67_013307 [Solanum verrucosum]